MSGAGHLQSMHAVIRNNRKLLRRRSIFKKDGAFLSSRKEYLKAAKGKIDFKKISKEELSLLRNKVIKQRRVESLRAWIITFLIGLPIIAFGFYISNNIIQNKNQKLHELFLKEQKSLQNLEESELEEKLNKYQFLIEDGDNWVEKEKWGNAIHQYKNAVGLFPEKYEANYRLALAYSYNCQYEKLDCEKGYKLLKKLQEFAPNDNDLLILEHVFSQ